MEQEKIEYDENMTRQEMNDKIQELWDNAPIKWAFGRSQFIKMLQEWGIADKPDCTSMLVEVGNGGYILKTDTDKLMEIKKQADKIREDFYKDDKNYKDELLRQFYDHDCAWTENPYDAVDDMGVELTEGRKQIVRTVWKMFCRKNKVVYFDPYPCDNEDAD